MTQQNKLQNLLTRAKIDLEKWLKFANVSTLDEFYTKEEEIRQTSYHKYHDVIEHLNFIKKIEVKLGK